MCSKDVFVLWLDKVTPFKALYRPRVDPIETLYRTLKP